jgi:hypothetical protein
MILHLLFLHAVTDFIELAPHLPGGFGNGDNKVEDEPVCQVYQ